MSAGGGRVLWRDRAWRWRGLWPQGHPELARSAVGEPSGHRRADRQHRSDDWPEGPVADGRHASRTLCVPRRMEPRHSPPETCSGVWRGGSSSACCERRSGAPWPSAFRGQRPEPEAVAHVRCLRHHADSFDMRRRRRLTAQGERSTRYGRCSRAIHKWWSNSRQDPRSYAKLGQGGGCIQPCVARSAPTRIARFWIRVRRRMEG